jgi:uncharacterized protein (DUF488 family)
VDADPRPGTSTWAEACRAPLVIHTVGHSTRTIEAFLALLREHAIERVLDVRRWPASRRHPQFGREPLASALGDTGIRYLWRGDLGGYRTPARDSPNTGWRTGTFRAYADFMLTPAFALAIDEVAEAARAERVALMCAEAVPWRCHRQLLADALVVRGWPVRHIMDAGCSAHRLTAFARPSGTRIEYPGDDPSGARS